LDLAQTHDHTALAMIEWPLRSPPSPPCFPGGPDYHLRTLKRWPVGTPYREIVAALVKFLKEAPLAGSGATLVIDETGVGRPVTSMIVESLMRARVDASACAVTITDAHEVRLVGHSLWQVPKKTLVAVLQVLLQGRRLQVSSGLPETATLVKELQLFRAKISVARTDTLEAWRERDYDDLVLAVSLACWWAECQQDWFIHPESCFGYPC